MDEDVKNVKKILDELLYRHCVCENKKAFLFTDGSVIAKTEIEKVSKKIMDKLIEKYDMSGW